MCELLSIRLLREYSTRELIDALNYEFDPLQGLATNTASTTPGMDTPLANRSKHFARAARVSTVEVAIRAQAKKFLSHPVVVQQLEAIWAGTIAFQSAADELHRHRSKQSGLRQGYGTLGNSSLFANIRTKVQLSKKTYKDDAFGSLAVKRAVTLYDPKDATLFKLSRLRVPRYRAVFSTISFAIMLGLFLAVLVEKSLPITFLEVLFWFWSAGYMLDEVVGFTVQGFGLYIMSFWNAFDIGILMLFVSYYVLRLIGILTSISQNRYIASMAYDVLAATAVLLFPRLFSVLDHYRYFSQLLIAFRMMAMDLVAVLVLIVIACSGFLVAFTLSFGDDDFDVASATYALFQMLMGFTPAAWEVWDTYNPLGKAILVLFLFICHFLVVTILITVLTNSFMAVVANANEEHQFLFAINTISMVKSDALFSYIPPTNIIGWLLIPTRFLLPFRQFVKLNRIVIKITHLPILFLIFFYERLILSYQAYDLADLVEQQGRGRKSEPAFVQNEGPPLFSPGRKIREPSVATFRKDLALDEVFRRPYRSNFRQNVKVEPITKRRSSDAVQDWMSMMGHEGGAAPPVETPRSVLERLESRKLSARQRGSNSNIRARRRQFSATSRSIVSDPEEANSYFGIRPHPIPEERNSTDMKMDDNPQATDADGDDELLTNDEVEQSSILPSRNDFYKENRIVNTPGNGRLENDEGDDEDSYFQTPKAVVSSQRQFTSSTPYASRSRVVSSVNLASSPPLAQSPKLRMRAHHRNRSTNTILYSPVHKARPSSTSSQSTSPPVRRPFGSQLQHSDRLQINTNVAPIARTSNQNMSSGRRTPRRVPGTPVLSQQQHQQQTPLQPQTLQQQQHKRHNRTAPITIPKPQQQPQTIGTILGLRNAEEPPSLSTRALDLASDLGDNRHGPDPGTALAMLPASLATEMGFAERHRAATTANAAAKAKEAEAAAAALSARAEAMVKAEVQQATAKAKAKAKAEVAGRDDMSRKVLARMSNLERSFRDIVREVKDWRKEGGGSAGGSVGGSLAGSKAGSRAVSGDEGGGDGNGEGGPVNKGKNGGRGGSGRLRPRAGRFAGMQGARTSGNVVDSTASAGDRSGNENSHAIATSQPPRPASVQHDSTDNVKIRDFSDVPNLASSSL